MKILVFSDSHGTCRYMHEAIKMNMDADALIYLGDGLSDFYSIEKGSFAMLAVRGNCDWEPMFSHIPKLDSITLDGKKILFTHGDIYGVKYGSDGLKRLARDTSADIVLFGHTHAPFESYDDDVYYFNPGTIGGAYSATPTFGVITIRNNEVLLSHGKFDD